ncbi:MAG: CDP-diacylglycerol--glycerol-3-phosphate 3-phosphatidyltransferase [Actinomycetota bacterium]|nr:CDP-diacylglycerol--glycerol-3-phosphate 3-phosphatidyltransferase [Actinomycetota bacterium]
MTPAATGDGGIEPAAMTQRSAPVVEPAFADRPVPVLPVDHAHDRPVLPEPTQVPVLNVANLLTVSRLALVPVFLVTLFVDDGQDMLWRLIATAVFGVASITDHIDGRLARKHGLVTDFGKIVDPIADKALTGSALVGLSILGALPWWVTIVIAVREVGVTLLRFWVIRHGVIPASRGGKLKTLTQVFAIALYLIPLPAPLLPIAWFAMGAAVVLTVVTGVDYVIRAVRLRARGKRAIA